MGIPYFGSASDNNPGSRSMWFDGKKWTARENSLAVQVMLATDAQLLVESNLASHGLNPPAGTGCHKLGETVRVRAVGRRLSTQFSEIRVCRLDRGYCEYSGLSGDSTERMEDDSKGELQDSILSKRQFDRSGSSFSFRLVRPRFNGHNLCTSYHCISWIAWDLGRPSCLRRMDGDYI